MKKFSLLISTLLIGIIGIGLPVSAEEVQEIHIDSWAIQDLNEGEKYGVYPIEWYYGDFKGPITSEMTQQLVQNTYQKLSGIEGAVIPGLVPSVEEESITREMFINQLVSLVGQSEGVAYFEANQLIKGEKEDFRLNDPCTTQEAVLFTTRFIDYVYQAYDAGSKGFMWKATKGGNTVYMMGSIHVGDYSMYPMDDQVKDAFNASDELYVEANAVVPTGMEEYLEKAVYQDGTTVDAYIPPELYARTIKAGEKLGLQEENLKQCKPWCLANELSSMLVTQSQDPVQAQQASTLGVDTYFILDALCKGKPVKELEGVAYQAELFDNLSEDYQINYLESVVEGIEAFNSNAQAESTDNQLDVWQSLWKKGDAEAFKKDYAKALAQTSQEDEIAAMLFGERDKHMATKIKALLDSTEPKTTFVVVGAGHLAQEDMVIDQLIEAGYNVQYCYTQK